MNAGKGRTPPNPSAVFESLEPRALLSAGELDPRFGTGGIAVHKLLAPLNVSARAAARQANGKTLVAGLNQNDLPTLARFNEDGSADSTFGVNGILQPVLPSSLSPAAVMVDAAGKIYLAGSGDSRFVVARLNADGSIDESYGAWGMSSSGGAGADRSYLASSATLLGDGRVLVAGGRMTRHVSNQTYEMAYVMLPADGRRGSVGGSVHVLPNPQPAENSFVAGVELLPSGGVLATGNIEDDLAVVKIKPSGELDSRFGNSGIITVHADQFEAGRAIAVLPTGDFFVAGSYGNDFMLARFNARGRSITSFGVGGVVRYDVGITDSTQDLVIAPDGRLLLIGSTDWPGDGSPQGLVASFLQRGRLDRSYGQRGNLQFVFGAVETLPGAPSPLEALYAQVAAATIGANGGLVVAGNVFQNAAAGHFLAVAQLKADGSFDENFGVGGRQAIAASQPRVMRASSYVIQADEKVVGVTADEEHEELVFTRFNADGSVDHSFGERGVFVIQSESWGGGTSLTIDHQGRIYATAIPNRLTPPLENLDHVPLIRLTPDGQLDETFGFFGRMEVQLPGPVQGIRIFVRASQLMLAAGTLGEFNVLAFDSTGQLDPSFGNGGRASITVNPAGGSSQHAYIWDVAIAPGGRLILGGSSVAITAPGPGGFSGGRAVLARLTADGHPDATFAGTGVIIYPAPPAGYLEGISAIGVLPDGKILAANGWGTSPADGFIAMSRYSTDGKIDTTFGDSGTAEVTFEVGASPYADDLAILPSGSILVSGYSFSPGDSNGPFARLMKLTRDGDLDPSFGVNGLAVEPENFPRPEGNVDLLQSPTNDDILMTLHQRNGFGLARFHG